MFLVEVAVLALILVGIGWLGVRLHRRESGARYERAFAEIVSRLEED